MGQANLRGTFEERQQRAIARDIKEREAREQVRQAEWDSLTPQQREERLNHLRTMAVYTHIGLR